VGEPLGLWLGHASQTGDASGGNVEVSFRPQNPADTPTLDDQRRQYVYFVDGIQMSANGAPGNVFARIIMHMARSNVTFTPPFSHIRASPTIDDGLALELATGNAIIVQLGYENNVLARVYRSAAYGRYYDRQLLGNRAFGRLVMPAAISQFEG